MNPALARRFQYVLLALVIAGAFLRGLWLTADPPYAPTVGVVWHDEGAWVHNARNKALFGSWRLDEWNPLYIAPVFTALEYASFDLFGVGTWQARIVSTAAGVLSIALLAGGIRRLAGPEAAIIAGALLTTNYVSVMYDRAATMEALMTACIVASWYCSTRALARPQWGALAGIMAVLAYFTKAAAAFYLAALGLAAAWSLWQERRERAAAAWTLAGVAAALGLAIVLFVLPHWSDYVLYNWQISVTRKPSYSLKSILDRVTWFPVLHDLFTRMWFELCVGIFGAWSAALTWRRSSMAERLLLLWLVVGVAELLVHDVGNERRFVFLFPVLIALSAIVLGRGRLLPADAAAIPLRRIWIFLPVLAYSAYVICGPLARLPFMYVVKPEVRFSALLGMILTTAVLSAWPRIVRFLSTQSWNARAAAAITAVLVAGDLVQFTQWAAGRTYKNYEASVTLGRVLPAGTLVQGKLANGLSLENRIRPIFIGHGFGNFADRKRRDDVRYILTYTVPATGYEGSQILDVLDAYPNRRIIMTFDVAETPSGHDRAALIEKRARD